jgi:RES domain-containing protein
MLLRHGCSRPSGGGGAERGQPHGRRHIYKAAHAAFDGKGAALDGGRWTLVRTLVVYTSATIPLAALELLAHLAPDETPDGLVAIAAGIPEAIRIERLAESRLPHNWRSSPAPPALADPGTARAREGRTAVLAVPSAVIPRELNYLLSPRHQEFRRSRSAGQSASLSTGECGNGPRLLPRRGDGLHELRHDQGVGARG